MSNLASLISKCKPGKHFIGLWVYRQHNYRTRKPRWTVTLFDHKNEYWEAPLKDSPEAALRAALKIVYYIRELIDDLRKDEGR